MSTLLPHQKCFREPWTTKKIETKMYTNCSFDLDGTVDKKQLKNYFVLTWSRQATPSVVKWTRDVHEVANNSPVDVHEVANNSPGCLRLSVPTVLFTSNRNVRSLVPILDNNIETFMKVRSKMHSLSSFK